MSPRTPKIQRLRRLIVQRTRHEYYNTKSGQLKINSKKSATTVTD